MVGETENRGEEDLSKVWESKDSDREICKICVLRVNSGEMGLVCDLCGRWYHAGCEKISKKEYEMISKIGEKGRWYCQRCRGLEGGMKEENRKYKIENWELNKKNRELNQEIGR